MAISPIGFHVVLGGCGESDPEREGFSRAPKRSVATTAGALTCSTKKSSSVSRSGFSETRCAPVAVSRPSNASGGGSSGSSSEYRPSPIWTTRRVPGRTPSTAASDAAGDNQLPAARAKCEHVGQAAVSDEAALGENRDAVAQRLGVAQDVRAEEDRAAAIAQIENQRSHVAATERIEAGHRLVEDDELGIVDERLGDAHALKHALRELPQLEPAFAADADLVEQTARAGATIAARVAEEPREIRQQFLGSQVVVEVRILRQVADAALDVEVADGTAENLGATRSSERPTA